MGVLRALLLVVELGCLVLLALGLVTQARADAGRLADGMRDLVGTAFVTGLFLVGLRLSAHLHVPALVSVVQSLLALLLVVTVSSNLGRRLPRGLAVGLLVLVVVDLVLAVLLVV